MRFTNVHVFVRHLQFHIFLNFDQSCIVCVGNKKNVSASDCGEYLMFDDYCGDLSAEWEQRTNYIQTFKIYSHKTKVENN